MDRLITNSTFNIYLSTPFNRTATTSVASRLRYWIDIGTEIQAYLLDWEKMDGFPKMNLYVPAEHETFIQLAYLQKFLTLKQINFINCNIIHLCNLFLTYGHADTQAIRYGKTELDWATDNGVPHYHMPDLSSPSLEALKLSIKLVLKSEGHG